MTRPVICESDCSICSRYAGRQNLTSSIIQSLPSRKDFMSAARPLSSASRLVKTSAPVSVFNRSDNWVFPEPDNPRIKVSVTIRYSSRRDAANSLPRAIHDLQHASAGFEVIDSAGPEFCTADVPAKSDHGLVDNHGFPVHGR